MQSQSSLGLNGESWLVVVLKGAIMSCRPNNANILNFSAPDKSHARENSLFSSAMPYQVHKSWCVPVPGQHIGGGVSSRDKSALCGRQFQIRGTQQLKTHDSWTSFVQQQLSQCKKNTTVSEDDMKCMCNCACARDCMRACVRVSL